MKETRENVSLFPRDWTVGVKESTGWGALHTGGRRSRSELAAGEARSVCNSVRDTLSTGGCPARERRGGARHGSQSSTPCVAATMRGFREKDRERVLFSIDRTDYLDKLRR